MWGRVSGGVVGTRDRGSSDGGFGVARTPSHRESMVSGGNR